MTPSLVNITLPIARPIVKPTIAATKKHGQSTMSITTTTKQAKKF